MDHQQLTDFVLDKIDDMKGRDIRVLNVKGKSTVTDTMIVCSGNSKRHVASIADHVIMELKAEGIRPLSSEGKDTGEWVLVDLGELILHVMQDETRDFYQLEKLWE
ncbi:Ribosomal silencing factor RsfS [Saliniradius amylolyticus]|uniref:Ribosomal silencing factor RsfS n=1 Tax=Saliniradius amylolyticus TaxID=2183582 RepID=A0A2S2E2G3_9ALTE|nr:ribosome silencing factor [Saliniradius amylolyticus]AWL11450.1 Ribosomal silencing factor RsfS [Saliniradius amylolyticus]